jgi:hypothetical protein
MGLTFNQNFTLGWNTLWTALSLRIGEDIIKRTQFNSPFTQFIQNLELGNYVQETYINPANMFLHDTVTNSDMLTDHTDTIMTTIHEVNVDLNIPSTYKNYIARTSFNFMDNVNNLIASLTANIRVTSEIAKQKIVKQMLYNLYEYGMIDTTVIPPVTDEASGEAYVIAINTLIDDFLTEPNQRNIIYNNQTPTPSTLVTGIATQIPYVIMFNEQLRTIEMLNALELVFGRYTSTTGNENQDYSRRLIRLQQADFPNSVPSTNRSDVTGQNVAITQNGNSLNINFFELPTNAAGTALFAGTPKGGTKPVAFVLEPSAIIMRSQLDVTTNFMNPATLATTNRLILRLVVSISGFDKIACIAN